MSIHLDYHLIRMCSTHLALVSDEISLTMEQINVLDHEETGLEDAFLGSEPTKQVRYGIHIHVHVHAQLTEYNIYVHRQQTVKVHVTVYTH